MDQTINDNIISKIRKLLALANNNPNENEAAAAAEKVQEILQNYNLSLADIGSEDDKAKRTTEAESAKRERTSHDKSAMYQYQRSLMKVIAKQFFCKWWTNDTFRADSKGTRSSFADGKVTRGRYVKTHFLLGREVNVVSAKLMYDYLVETMDNRLPYQGMEKRGKNAMMWLDGCTERLTERLEEITRKRNTTETTQAQGLVRLVDVYSNEADLNADAYYGYAPGTTAKNRAESEKRWEEMKASSNSMFSAQIAETPAEKAKREKREKKWDEAYWRRADKKAQEEQIKRSSSAFRSGRNTGDSIGLDQQVKA